MDDSTLATGAGSGIIGMLIMTLVQWYKDRGKEAAETQAVISDATGKTNLIEALEARILASETRQTSQDTRIAELETRIAKEIDLRLVAQEENHALRLRVSELEFAIRTLGGTVPVGVHK
jgi:hypothetical protein